MTGADETIMLQRIITVVLLIGLFFGLITLVSGMSAWRLPDREQGYAPIQPHCLFTSCARGRTADRLSVLSRRAPIRVDMRAFRRVMSA